MSVDYSAVLCYGIEIEYDHANIETIKDADMVEEILKGTDCMVDVVDAFYDNSNRILCIVESMEVSDGEVHFLSDMLKKKEIWDKQLKEAMMRLEIEYTEPDWMFYLEVY